LKALSLLVGLVNREKSCGGADGWRSILRPRHLSSSPDMPRAFAIINDAGAWTTDAAGDRPPRACRSRLCAGHRETAV